MHAFDPVLFSRIVRHARWTNPFYRRWTPQGGPVPILTRRVLQEHNDEILNGRPETGRTSGSTGTPVRVHFSPNRHKREQMGITYLVRLLGGSMARTEIIYPRASSNPKTTVPIHTPVAEQLTILASRHGARGGAIITYPSNAVLLAQAILEGGHDFGFIRRVGLMAESIDPGQRAVIQRGFPRARVWSNYSSTETGLISFQCPHEPDFHHILAGKLGLEILDESGRPCPPGQTGRVIITDYWNAEMPLIRYEIGDLAAFGQCPCGKVPLPAMQNILGKVRGCLMHRDGRRVPFIELSVALRDLPGMRQYQVIQEGLEHFHVKVAAAAPLDDAIRAAFAAEFGYAPHLRIEAVTEIPRDPSGKFHAAICRVDTAEGIPTGL